MKSQPRGPARRFHDERVQPHRRQLLGRHRTRERPVLAARALEPLDQDVNEPGVVVDDRYAECGGLGAHAYGPRGRDGRSGPPSLVRAATMVIAGRSGRALTSFTELSQGDSRNLHRARMPHATLPRSEKSSLVRRATSLPAPGRAPPFPARARQRGRAGVFQGSGGPGPTTARRPACRRRRRRRSRSPNGVSVLRLEVPQQELDREVGGRRRRRARRRAPGRERRRPPSPRRSGILSTPAAPMIGVASRKA